MLMAFPSRRNTRMALAFRLVHPLTSEELEDLSRLNSGIRFERSAGGELIVSPPMGTLGGRGESHLTFQLESWAQRDKRGFVTSSCGGFTLPDGAVFAPDGAWVLYERWNALSHEDRKGYARIAPDVVFELLSPSDTLADVRVKASMYLANGTRLVVLLDPHSRLVELHRVGGVAESQACDAGVPLDPEMPGFVLDAAAVFGRMEG
jgi:Uma2 family endonuclease